MRHALRESQAIALPLGFIGVGLGLAFFAITRDELFAGISVVSLLLGIGYLRSCSVAASLRRSPWPASAMRPTPRSSSSAPPS